MRENTRLFDILEFPAHFGLILYLFVCLSVEGPAEPAERGHHVSEGEPPGGAAAVPAAVGRPGDGGDQAAQPDPPAAAGPGRLLHQEPGAAGTPQPFWLEYHLSLIPELTTLVVSPPEQAAGVSEEDGRAGGGASEGQQQSLPHWSPAQPDDYQGEKINNL